MAFTFANSYLTISISVGKKGFTEVCTEAREKDDGDERVI